MDKISVIIPCYQVEKYLDRCMISLEKQTVGMNDLEIILVDDASKDGTWQKIREWEARFPENVIAVHYEENGRQGKARNVGLSYASGEWIAFIDSDDWVEPAYFEKLRGAAKRDGSDVSYCRLIRDHSKDYHLAENPKTGRADRLWKIDTKDRRKEFLVLADMSFPAHSRLIRKSVLTDNGLRFPEGLAYEDNCWGALLYYYVDSVSCVEETLYHYFVNEQSTVMVKGAGYHTDLLTVHLELWEEYLKRELYPEYKDEIEYNFLYNCYLGFLKILANRYEIPDYSQFLLMKEIVLEKVPDFRNNRYIKNGDIRELHLAMLELLDRQVDRAAFSELMDAVRRSGM